MTLEAVKLLEAALDTNRIYIRKASVRILIRASNPTRKKEPTRAIYSLL